MQNVNLNALIRIPTWYQPHNNATHIDNILTNQKALFKLSKKLKLIIRSP